CPDVRGSGGVRDLFHDAGQLVTENARIREVRLASAVSVQVGAADADAANADERFSWLDRRAFRADQVEAVRRFAYDRSHVRVPPVNCFRASRRARSSCGSDAAAPVLPATGPGRSAPRSR